MKRNLLLALSAMIVMATAHAQTLQVNLSWTAPGGATTITVVGTGVEASPRSTNSSAGLQSSMSDCGKLLPGIQ